MEMFLLFGSVLLAGMITGRKARTIREILLILTSMSFVLLIVSLVLFFHFVYINELLFMVCGFIFCLMVLLVWGKEHLISIEKTSRDLTTMIYNMLILYTLGLGGLLIAFRVMYPLENPHILPYFTYLSYPLLFGVLLLLLLWFVRFLLYRKTRDKQLTNGTRWIIIIIFFVFIFNTFNIFYPENTYEQGDPQKSLFHDIAFYEAYEFTSLSIPLAEDIDRISVQDYYYTEDSLYVAVRNPHYFDQESTYSYYQFSQDSLALIDRKELTSFYQFLGEIDSTILYHDATNDTVSTLDGSIKFKVSNYILDYELTNSQITLLTRFYDDGMHYDEYVYNLDTHELTITEDVNYDHTRLLYNDEGEVIETIPEENIIYEDETVLYFHYPFTYREVYRYQQEEITFFTTMSNYQEIIPTKHGILLVSNNKGTMYDNNGEIIGQVTLHGGAYSQKFQGSFLHKVLDDGTLRYITINQSIDDNQMDISYVDLHSPHIPIYLQYYMSPFVGLFLIIGLFPFKKQGF